MKKKTRFKLRNNLAGAFWSTISFCIIGAAYFGFLFYMSFFSTLSKLNETPIAYISFKYKTAQRKFIDRVVWDRLRQDSPLYNGDTIHTAPLAEATITFIDGNVMELMENTMAQVFLDDTSGVSANLEGGSLFVDGTASERGVILNASGMSVNMEAGAAVSAGVADAQTDGSKAVQFNVHNGNAAYTLSDGSVQTAASGEGFDFNFANGGFEAVTRPSLTVTSPVPNAKLIYHTEGTTDVQFLWNARNFENETQFILEIAGDKDFKTVISSKYVSEMERAVMPLKSGTYYWRLRTLTEAESIPSSSGPALPVSEAEDTASKRKGNLALAQFVQTSGKMQIIQSLPPALIAPVQNYTYNFRSQLPAVRLIWTECEGASSYRLEISKDASFNRAEITQRTSSCSSIISTLKAGSYYWRVTPYYSINREGYALPSQTGVFEIVQKGNLTPPVLLLPGRDAVLNTDEASRDMTFSWRPDDEAARYTVLIADNPQFRNPKVRRETTENYLVLTGKERNLSDGQWYWTVFLTDMEGNTSSRADAQSFYSLRGDLEQHTIEPVSGYRVAQNLLMDLKFTWKQNLPSSFKTVYQLAADRDFTEIIYQQNVNGESIKGIYIPYGKYFWRIVSTATMAVTAENGEESESKEIKFVTPGKAIEVLKPLDAPVVLQPLNRAVAREETGVVFEWKEIEGADFYKFNIYRKKDGSLVHSDNIYETATSLNMFGNKFEDKAEYRIELQAMSNAVPGISSRRSGLLSQCEFTLVKLRPVDVQAPAKNARINGLDAILKPGKITWSSVDEVREAQIVVTKVDESIPRVVLKRPTDRQFAAGNKIAPKTSVLDNEDGLEPGKYELIVYAKTLDGIDISNSSSKNITRFTILPVEPLSAVKNASVNPQELNAEYLAQTHRALISLKWQPVTDATEYKVAITNQNGKVLYSKNVIGKTEYNLDLLEMPEAERRIMQNGIFNYSVEPLRRIDTNGDGTPDKIIQRGPASSGKFTTKIEDASEALGHNVKNSFGRKKK